MKMGMGEEEVSLDAWLDRHHVNVVRTQAISLDGITHGSYVYRDKFTRALPASLALPDLILRKDIAGSVYPDWWHEFWPAVNGTILLKPDLSTLFSDGKDAELGHCIVDYVDSNGNDILLGPRAQLKHVVSQLSRMGFDTPVAFEPKFFLFKEPFEDAREKKYKNLTPAGATGNSTGHLSRNAYYSRPFMEEVTRLLNWQGIAWESWSDADAPGQLKLTLEPTNPILAADNIIRIKELIYEVAVDMGMSVTFMAKPVPGSYDNGMHIHHSLVRQEEPAFYDADCTNNHSKLFKSWLGGLIATMPGAVSLLRPNINSFHHFVDPITAPTGICWGENDHSTALRTIVATPTAARIEYRINSTDANPYLALIALIAGGITGLTHKLEPAHRRHTAKMEIPEEYPQLPTGIIEATEALQNDPLLPEVIDGTFIQYWIKSRQWEFQMYRAAACETDDMAITDWELNRYFELV